MGIIIRQGIQTSVIAYLGVVIGAFNLLWLFPKYLEPGEIGLLQSLQSVAALFSSLARLGTPRIADKFFPVFKNHDQGHRGFLSLLLGYSSLGFSLFCLIFIPFKYFWLEIYQENSPEINQYFYYVVLLVFFLIIHGVLESYMRVHLKTVIPSFYRDVLLRLLFTLLIIIYFTGVLSFPQVVLGTVISYGVIDILLLHYIYKARVLFLKPDFDFIKFPLIKEILTYGSVVVLSGISSIVVGKVDTLMIPAFLDLEETGIYAIAFYMGAVIEIPRKSISQISSPIISVELAANNIDKIQDIYRKSALNQFIAGGLLFLGIWCNIDDVFQLIPNSETYQAGKYVVFFIGLAKLVEMGTGLSTEIILQSDYYRFNLFTIIFLAVLLVVTNLIFIPIYGINGAAFATMLSILLWNLVNFLFILIKFKIQPFDKNYAIALLIFGFTFGVAQFVPEFSSPVVTLMVRSGIIAVTFLGLILLTRISADINRLTGKMLKRIKKFFN